MKQMCGDLCVHSGVPAVLSFAFRAAGKGLSGIREAPRAGTSVYFAGIDFAL